jgi:hypothetical protein
MTFSENQFIPFYNYIMAIFALILIIITVANSIGYTQIDFSWETNDKKDNPIGNLLGMMNLRSTLIQTLNYQTDFDEYK